MQLIILKSPRGITAGSIGVISPYAAQSKKIRQELDRIGCSETKVGTVEFFQGTLGVGWVWWWRCLSWGGVVKIIFRYHFSVVTKFIHS